MQPYVLFSPKEWRLPARSFIINLFILTLLSVTLLSSQTPYWHWAKRAGGTLNEKGNSIAVDEQGNSHVIGNFTSAEITLGSTTFPNVSGFDEYSDLFLVKYDPSGNVVWATTAGGTDDEYGYGIAVDASGNSFVTGTFNSPTLTFGSTTLTRNGDFDIFIAKYDANGNAVWATGAGGTGGDEGKKIAVDASGNSYVTGRFTSPTLTFGSTTLTNNGLGDIFIVKYDANGNVAWASSAGGTSRDYGEGVAVGASGKISLAGYFTSPTITIGSITLSNTTSDDNDDIFVVQYDTNGSVQWAASAGGIGFDRASDISLDDSGNSYVTGTFENSDITFGTFTLTNLGFNDIFVVKYGSAGNVVWARSAGGTGGEYGTCISTDASGNSYVGGYFKSSTLTFDTTALSNNGGGDIFLANYDVSGNTVWATSVGGIANEYAYGIFVDASGNSFVTGEFSSDTLIFDSDTLIENGYDDFFVAKFGPPSASIITASSGPNGNITPSGDVTVYNGATQQFTFTANTGYHVDSVIVDGVNIGSTTSYTFENVTANHTIQVVFAINTYTLTVGGDNGVVGKNPNLESYEHGTTVQVSQTPDRGYIFTGWSGDASGTDNPLSVTMDRNKSILANYLVNSDYEVRYRTAKYEDWATAKDGKGALKSIKRKADKVFFKFNLTRATASNLLLLDFGMDVNAIITRGKAKTDTIVRFSTNKFKGELETVAAGETIQVEGIGKKGKKITVKYQWGTAKAVTMKADSLYKINRVGLPMPNLHNVVEELFAQGAFPGGLQIGYPQGAKGANSVIHKKYADVQKSMVKIVMKNPKLH
ncbi:MAG: hypothetical protein HYZ34_03215, partial [Ignavibacteriae bacterium]|nr:hypothetical protein [Ignavibacteriota bacterium]